MYEMIHRMESCMFLKDVQFGCRSCVFSWYWDSDWSSFEEEVEGQSR